MNAFSLHPEFPAAHHRLQERARGVGERPGDRPLRNRDPVPGASSHAI